MRHSLFLSVLLLGAGSACRDDAPKCSTNRDSVLLVSGYFSNNVTRYGLCGEVLGSLDDAGRIRGAQATALGSDGLLYVVSEENRKVLRYHGGTFLDEFVSGSPLPERPTAFVFAANGDAFVGGYADNTVVRLDAGGSELGRFDLSAELQGLDAGMAVLPDGRLLVPGYDSGNVVALNVYDGTSSVWASGLSNPRVIRLDAEHSRVLLSNQGRGEVLAFGYDGTPQGVVARLAGVTGFALDEDGVLFATNDRGNYVRRISSRGEAIDITEPEAGGLNGGTFITIAPASFR